MEYTNDSVFKLQHEKNAINIKTKTTHKLLKNILKKIQKDEYFTLALIISIIALFFDAILVKQFVEVLNLL